MALPRLEPNSQTPQNAQALFKPFTFEFPQTPNLNIWINSNLTCADFYLYDETPDDHQLSFWQWPRVDPTANFFRNSGFCEDGAPSTTGTPMGEYHITFGGMACASASVVATQTGTYGGCGRQAYTPCSVGAPPHSLLVFTHAHAHTPTTIRYETSTSTHRD